jgi:hypothetical protein
MQFILDNRAVPITTVEELRQQLERVRRQQFSEVWVDAGEEGPALAMVVNGVHAWLMYLRDHHGDPGFSSPNPYDTGPAEATTEFLLSNGQMDEYPVAWTLPLEEACAACEYFVLSQGGQSPAIIWHDDSSSEPPADFRSAQRDH